MTSQPCWQECGACQIGDLCGHGWTCAGEEGEGGQVHTGKVPRLSCPHTSRPREKESIRSFIPKLAGQSLVQSNYKTQTLEELWESGVSCEVTILKTHSRQKA